MQQIIMNLLSHENLLTQYGYHCGFLIIFVFLYYINKQNEQNPAL